MTKLSILTRGILKENPIFVILLGMCPTLATTSSAINGFGMGMATLFVLVMSNIAIASVAKLIPGNVRIPSYIVIIATFVTVVDLLMQAYVPDVHKTLGLFIPLIVVNCIVLGRAEAFASKNNVTNSALDGLGMGIGFTLSLTVLGAVRELVGNYSIFDYKFIEQDGVLVFILAPGAFMALAYLMVFFNIINSKKS